MPTAEQVIERYIRSIDGPVVDAGVANDLTADFISVARPFSERFGITFGAWRDIGVPCAVLKQADIPKEPACNAAVSPLRSGGRCSRRRRR